VAAHRTKIVATVGPATSSRARIRDLLLAGADVFRINLSHGERADHARLVETIRAVARERGRFPAILVDLQGPRVRLGKLESGTVRVRRGDRVDLVGDGAAARPDALRIPVTYARLARDVRPGHRILVADGAIELRVRGVARNGRVETVVRVGGPLASSKGINLPDSSVSIPTLTARDRRDITFAAREGVEWVGVSFVRSADDLHLARRLLARAGSGAGVVAKIERREAVRNLTEILEAADAVMVARGDLAIEVGYETVPVLQKRILREANALGRPSITATQMLESMIESPRPTRAEASDVANAIFDGTDAVMLSGETAIGRFPVTAVRTMQRIASRAERELESRGFPVAEVAARDRARSALARAAIRTAAEIGATRIVPFTLTGDSARRVSRERPVAPIVAAASSEEVGRRLALAWGVRPLLVPHGDSLPRLVARAEAALVRAREVRAGDRLVFLAGTSRIPGGTNTLRIHVVAPRRGRRRNVG